MEVPAGWDLRLVPSSLGTCAWASDLSSGLGVLVQPRFILGEGPPHSVALPNMFPSGSLGALTEDLRLSLERQASSDIGANYKVSAELSHEYMFDVDYDLVTLTIRTAD